jgi:hypothetical protein
MTPPKKIGRGLKSESTKKVKGSKQTSKEVGVDASGNQKDLQSQESPVPTPESGTGTRGLKKKATTVVRDLSYFGLNPAPIINDDGIGMNGINQNASELRIAIIEGVEGKHDIVLRCEPTGYMNRNYSWSEKILSDAVKDPNSWTSSFNLNQKIFTWYHNNVEQVNRSGYGVRMFHIPVCGKINNNKLLEMCTHICELITNSEKNTERITVNVDQLFWLRGKVVWSDVVGHNRAMSLLKKQKGIPHPGYYEAHEEFILTYFRKDDVEAMTELYGPVV